MAGYNGSGTFVRTYDWTTDEGNGINIEAARMDTEDDGFATGLSTAITKDGQTTISANIPFNSKKITGLGNGSARTDSIAIGQVQDGTYLTLGTAGGAADVYTASPSPAITAYATGMDYSIKIQADNTGATTLNVSAVGAKAIKKYDGAGAKVALAAGDLQADQYYRVLYDGTDFVLMNPLSTPITTRGDIIRGSSTGSEERLGLGTTGYFITSDGTDVIWQQGARLVQQVSTETGAVATGTTTMPADDTIPQNTEGDQYMSLAITPTSSSNKLKIDVVLYLGHSATNFTMSGALFQDSTAGSLACMGEAINSDGSLGYVSNLSFTHHMTAGTASETTFKIRAGSNSSGTTTFNGYGGARKFGGVLASSITITEIKA